MVTTRTVDRATTATAILRRTARRTARADVPPPILPEERRPDLRSGTLYQAPPDEAAAAREQDASMS